MWYNRHGSEVGCRIRSPKMQKRMTLVAGWRAPSPRFHDESNGVYDGNHATIQGRTEAAFTRRRRAETLLAASGGGFFFPVAQNLPY